MLHQNCYQQQPSRINFFLLSFDLLMIIKMKNSSKSSSEETDYENRRDDLLNRYSTDNRHGVSCTKSMMNGDARRN